jgi:hypothetical protein
VLSGGSKQEHVFDAAILCLCQSQLYETPSHPTAAPPIIHHDRSQQCGGAVDLQSRGTDEPAILLRDEEVGKPVYNSSIRKLSFPQQGENLRQVGCLC